MYIYTCVYICIHVKIYIYVCVCIYIKPHIFSSGNLKLISNRNIIAQVFFFFYFFFLIFPQLSFLTFFPQEREEEDTETMRGEGSPSFFSQQIFLKAEKMLIDLEFDFYSRRERPTN